MTIHLFIPCYVDHYAPHIAHSLCDLLDALKISWHYPKAQTCCGQFAFNAGDWPTARRLMRHFFTVFHDADLILCPSASCVLTIRHHYPQLIDHAADATLLRRLQPRVHEFSEWLVSIPSLPIPLTFPQRVFLHQSCSARQLGILPHLKKLLGLVAGLQLAELPPTFSCCGFGGLFSIKKSDLAQTIGSHYLTAVLQTGAAALVSPDVGCLLHLQRLLAPLRLKLPMYYLAEILQLALHNR